MNNEEAIAGAARYIDRARQSNALAAEEWARNVWSDWFSRVRPAAPEPEVCYGPCELRNGVWVLFDSRGDSWSSVRVESDRDRQSAFVSAVRVGDVPVCPPPKPAPPMPDGDPPKRIIARRAGDSFHGVMRDDGFIYIGPGMYHYESPRAAERKGGWEIEIVEDKAND